MSNHKKPDSAEVGNQESLWGGRFSEPVDPLVQKYTQSIHFDRRLGRQDLEGSRAHVRMLASRKILSEADAGSILGGLDQIEQELEKGTFPFKDELEDIHMNIEKRLQDLIGDPGGRLHTGRSRNDQVALDVRLFCLQTARQWKAEIVLTISSLLNRATELAEDLLPAWTHLQAAQPISWGHYLMAFVEMLGRDFKRLDSFRKLHSVSPLGAGALSGSSLDLDPEFSARELGMAKSFGNSYDAVGDRDCLLELTQIATQMMLHMSRFAEDFIYFNSTPVSWIELPDSVCTGSSMMPQKKNPDLLELMRGKTASVLGHGQALCSLLKGLPTSYHRDLQQDKLHLFEVVDITADSIKVMRLATKGFQINRGRIVSALRAGYLMATELAEYLVARGVPFRTAHQKIGNLIQVCIQRNVELSDLDAEVLRELVPEFGNDITVFLNPEIVLKRRMKGSTGISSIRQQLADWQTWVDQQNES